MRPWPPTSARPGRTSIRRSPTRSRPVPPSPSKEPELMAADLIPVNRTKQPGNKIVRTADLLNEVRKNLGELVASGGHGFQGVDYSTFESYAGLSIGAGANTLALLTIMHN